MIEDMKRIPLSNGFQIQLDRIYTVEKLLGTGTYTLVYQASFPDHTGVSHKVILREVYPRKFKMERQADGSLFCPARYIGKLERDIQEIQKQFAVALKLQQEFLGVQAAAGWDTFEKNGTLYTIQIFQPGCTLDSCRIESLSELFDLALSLAKWLSLLHQKGWLCQDLKPENLYKLYGVPILSNLDFDGLCKQAAFDPKAQDISPRVVMTRGYSAPELSFSNPSIRSDLYSFGVILFWMLMGRIPADAETDHDAVLDFSESSWKLKDFDDQVERKLRYLFKHLIVSYPKARFDSIEKVIPCLEDLRELSRTSHTFVRYARLQKNPFMSFERPSGYDPQRIYPQAAARFRDLLKSERIFQVYGIPGIGKSAFTAGMLADAPRVLYLFWKHNLYTTLADDLQFSIHGLRQDPKESDEEYAGRKLQILSRIEKGNPVMMVMDDFPAEADCDFLDLHNAGIQIILVTRARIAGLPDVWIQPVDSLAYWYRFFEDAVKAGAQSSSVFRKGKDEPDPSKGYSGFLDLEQKDAIQILVEKTGGHTLSLYLAACFCRVHPDQLIPLARSLAKEALESFTPRQTAKTTRGVSSGTMFSLLEKLVFSALDLPARNLLGLLCLFERPISFEALEILYPGLDQSLPLLQKLGWVSSLVHPLIRAGKAEFMDGPLNNQFTATLADTLRPQSSVFMENLNRAVRKGEKLEVWLDMALQIYAGLPYSPEKEKLLMELFRIMPFSWQDFYERYESDLLAVKTWSLEYFGAVDKLVAWHLACRDIEGAEDIFNQVRHHMPVAYQNLLWIDLMNEKIYPEPPLPDRKRRILEKQVIKVSEKTIRLLKNDPERKAALEAGLVNFLINCGIRNPALIRRLIRSSAKNSESEKNVARCYLLAYLDEEHYEDWIRKALDQLDLYDESDQIEYVLIPMADTYRIYGEYEKCLELLEKARTIALEKPDIVVYRRWLEDLEHYIAETREYMNQPS